MTDKDHGGVDVDSPEYPAYKSAADKYLPLAFDRSRGWSGKTYVAALEFCGILPGYQVCPYEAICPVGPGSAPLGGPRAEAKGSWAPILDSANEWVQVGEDFSCWKYSDKYPETPSWSVTGIGSEEVTRHILCCALGGYVLEEKEQATKAEEKTAALPGKTDKPTATSSSSSSPELLLEAASSYEDAITRYQPKLYNRKNGFVGTSYLDAAEFCGRVKMNGDVAPALAKKSPLIGNYEICPYA